MNSILKLNSQSTRLVNPAISSDLPPTISTDPSTSLPDFSLPTYLPISLPQLKDKVELLTNITLETFNELAPIKQVRIQEGHKQ